MNDFIMFCSTAERNELDSIQFQNFPELEFSSQITDRRRKSAREVFCSFRQYKIVLELYSHYTLTAFHYIIRK
jgi:hypothetical protein